ncbi:MAG: hypothetical protein R3B95_17610 [Nitrospirales bacterium]|nr:hypothetical protein [Nitrospirales bacterium]
MHTRPFIDFEEKGPDYPYGFVRWTETRNLEAFLRLLQQKKVKLRPFVSHRCSIEQAEDAYSLLTDHPAPYLGILIAYPTDQPGGHSRVIELVPNKPANM